MFCLSPPPFLFLFSHVSATAIRSLLILLLMLLTILTSPSLDCVLSLKIPPIRYLNNPFFCRVAMKLRDNYATQEFMLNAIFIPRLGAGDCF